MSAHAVLGGLRWLAGLSLPCSMQRWLDGHQVDALSTDQAYGVGDLRVLSTSGATAHDCCHTIERAVDLASSLVDTIGTSAGVFGVVHGHLNPDNIIVASDLTIQFIDLAQIVVAPHLWDLGTAVHQRSIPAQRTSALFHTNVRRLATDYCHDLVSGVPFTLE